jgi:NAD(P)-dependent dehydrogenase (short-subunit alcohol dehydrogenase family)
MNLTGRTMVVTGAGGGIGGAVARCLAERGAALVLVDQNPDAADAVLSELPPGEHVVEAADVSDLSQVVDLFVRLLATGIDLAGVVNAAGIVTGGEPWPASDLRRMAMVLEVNAIGTAVLSTLVAQHSDDGVDRVVVNVSSVAALRTHPPDPAYAASKAAVLAFTRSAAAASTGTRFNAVLPGVVRTPMLDSTGSNGPAPWLAPRLDGPLLSAEQVANVITGQVVGDADGQVLTVELDKTDPALVITAVV